MNKIRIILLLFSVLKFSLVKADAAPKLHPRLEIQFTQNDEVVTDFDSIHVVYHLLKGQLDTMYVSERWWNADRQLNHFRYHYPGHGGNYVLEFLNPVTDFQIFLIHEGKQYSSEKINFVGARSFQEFELSEDGRILDVHNLFYAHWSYYFISLVITIILELLLAFIFVKTLKGQFKKFLFVVVVINFISHPILWYLDSRIDVSLATLETGVIIFEIILLSRSLQEDPENWQLCLFRNYSEFNKLAHWRHFSISHL